MSKLSNLIDKECGNFIVNITPNNHEVFIEIVDIESGNFHYITVATANEYEGLLMILADWKYLKITDDLNYSIN